MSLDAALVQDTAPPTYSSLGSQTTVNATPDKSTGISKEEKLTKNRLLARRSYYKKRQVLLDLRDEVTHLENDFEALLEQLKEKNKLAAGAFSQGNRRITLRDLYAELTLVRCSLVKEQQQLKWQIADRHQRHERVKQLFQPRG